MRADQVLHLENDYSEDYAEAQSSSYFHETVIGWRIQGDDINGGPECNVHDKLESLIDIACESSTPLKVLDDDNQLVGEIDQSMILKAMNSR